MSFLFWFTAIIAGTVLLAKMNSKNKINSSNSAKYPSSFDKSIEELDTSENKHTNPKFNRTYDDDELSFAFSYKYEKEISFREKILYDLHAPLNNIYDIDKHIDACKKEITSFYELRDFCYSKGKGGKLYFDDMWLHCHNSKNPDFSFIESTEKYLKKLSNNYEAEKQKLIDKKTRLDFKPVATNTVIKTIKHNDGILQKDLHKLFAPCLKSAVNATLQKLVDKGEVKKRKQGNSYELTINSGEI